MSACNKKKDSLVTQAHFHHCEGKGGPPLSGDRSLQASARKTARRDLLNVFHKKKKKGKSRDGKRVVTLRGGMWNDRRQWGRYILLKTGGKDLITKRKRWEGSGLPKSKILQSRRMGRTCGGKGTEGEKF